MSGKSPQDGTIAADGSGGASQVGFSLIVTNVAPAVNAGADAVLASGQTLTVNAAFTDPGTAETHSATIDFGEGAGPQPAAVSEAGGSGTVTGTHTYFAPNTYMVRVCVTDKDGGVGCDDLSVQVNPVTVSIDIKPGSSPNSINLGSNGVVAVAILSTNTFDATTVDPLSITLANSSVKLRGNGTPQTTTQDVNGDGRPDLVVQVNTEALQLTQTDTQATLRGRTASGVYITGVDSVRVVPQ